MVRHTIPFFLDLKLAKGHASAVCCVAQPLSIAEGCFGFSNYTTRGSRGRKRAPHLCGAFPDNAVTCTWRDVSSYQRRWCTETHATSSARLSGSWEVFGYAPSRSRTHMMSSSRAHISLSP